MGALVNETDHQQKKPKLHQIRKRLFGEIEVKRDVRGDDIPLCDEDYGLEQEEHDGKESEPAIENVLSNFLVELCEVAVGVPGGELYVRDVDACMAPCAAAPLSGQLFIHGYIFFLRILVPESAFAHVFREGPHFLRGKRDFRFRLEHVRNLFVSAHSVEQLGKLPLGRLQP